LILRDNDEAICRLDDDDKMLGFYSVVSGMEIHIIDNNPYSITSGGQLENVALVEKYVMPDEVYDKRKGTLRDYKRERQKKDPSFTFASGMRKKGEQKAGGEHKVEAPPEAEDAAHCVVGERCEVTPGKRRGVVAFVGEVPSISKGYFVGVQLDEPAGRHDGMCPKGTRYFECAMKYVDGRQREGGREGGGGREKGT
jgi:tubulin-folding cofactor B